MRPAAKPAHPAHHGPPPLANADVNGACLKLVKSFLTQRLTNEFKRPKRPLTDRGDLKKNGVADVWIAFVDALDNKTAFDLLKVRAGGAGGRRAAPARAHRTTGAPPYPPPPSRRPRRT